MNLPVSVAGQQATTPDEPEADPLQIPQDDEPPAINDPALRIETVADGLEITLTPGEVLFTDGSQSFNPRNPFDEDFEMLIHLVRK